MLHLPNGRSGRAHPVRERDRAAGIAEDDQCRFEGGGRRAEGPAGSRGRREPYQWRRSGRREASSHRRRCSGHEARRRSSSRRPPRQHRRWRRAVGGHSSRRHSRVRQGLRLAGRLFRPAAFGPRDLRFPDAGEGHVGGRPWALQAHERRFRARGTRGHGRGAELRLQEARGLLRAEGAKARRCGRQALRRRRWRSCVAGRWRRHWRPRR